MEFLQEYIEEVKGILKDIEKSMMTLESNFEDIEEINNAYRYLHTLKGSAGMFEFHEVERLSHELESVFSDIRDGVRQADNFVIDLTLHAVDVLSDLIDSKDASKETEELIAEIHRLRGITSEGALIESASEDNKGNSLYTVIITPSADIFKRGVNFQYIIEDLADLGTTEVIIHNESVPFETQLANKEIVSWFEVLLATEKSEQDIKDVFMFMQPAEYEILALRNPADLTSEGYQKHIYLYGEDLQHRLNILENFEPSFISAFAEAENKKESPVEAAEESKKRIDLDAVKELAENDEDAPLTIEKKSGKKASSVSVATDKLDKLINIVSELVIFRSEFQHLMGETENPAIIEAMEKMEHLTLKLRDSAFNIRLVPLNVLNVKLQRMIRSVAQELGKEVEFIHEGMDTELDRSMISALEAPLLHLIRNAIDHGIESPEERERLNKPRKGLLKFYSYNSGDHVFIQVQDDGKGINFEKIRQKGIEKGLLNKNQVYSEKELLNVMMSPGFSTAEAVTKVSGRGVGMDVVKKEIAAIRGDLEISTEEGLGSIFTIRLPLTLTILDTLVVNVKESKYLIPISEVEFCYEETHDTLFKKKSRQIEHQGHLMPFVSLREYFGVDEVAPGNETVIIINKNDTKVAVVVDGIVGKLQTVYKPLNELLRPAHCFSGASILGDGSMALILNALKLKN